MRKLAEGGYNRIFLITMHDGFKMVARIPYPVTVPKYFVIASEVATMDFLHSSGLPIPKVYGYSPSPDNAADTEYIFMEFVEGTILMDVWSDLGREDIISITCQLAELESKMMSIAFPAGGSLYYAQDLEKVVGKPGIPLEDKRFCVGPDVRLPLWQGRRSQLDIDRGPCMPLFALFYCSFKLTNNYRQNYQSSPRKRSRKRTSLSAAVWSTAVAVPSVKAGSLPVPRAAAVGPRREPGPLSPHCVVTCPQQSSHRSFPHPSSRPPTKQYHRFQIA